MTTLFTKIAGTVAIPGVQEILAKIQSSASFPLTVSLVPEPDNKYDGDAIKVIVTNKKGQEFHIGYIRNSNSICYQCYAEYSRFPPEGKCSACGKSETVSRYGLATKLKGKKLSGVMIEVTGGTEGKNYGANLKIEYKEER